MRNSGGGQKRAKSGTGAIAPADRVEGGPTRVAFLVRVSWDEQDDRGPIENQKQYLERQYAADFESDSPQPMVLVGTYEDPGVSGAIRLEDRRQVAASLTIVQRDALTW